MKYAPKQKNNKDHGYSRIREKSWRSFLKTLSHRLISTASTILIAWWITGDVSSALGIGGLEFFIKILIYYLHERLWSRLKIGLVIEKFPAPDYQI